MCLFTVILTLALMFKSTLTLMLSIAESAVSTSPKP